MRNSTISLTLGLALASGLAEAAATITVINLDAAGVGFNDSAARAPVGGNSGTTVGQQRLNVFTAAANQWGATIASNVTIRVEASFAPLPCTANAGTLGSAGPSIILRNFTNAPLANTWYPKALANKLAGFELMAAEVDVSAEFNGNLGQANCLSGLSFYLGLDNNHGSNIDLYTVILHELAHGLGFLTTTSASTGALQSGFPSVADTLLFDNILNRTWTAMSAAERAASAIGGNRLAWNGASTNFALPLVLSAAGDGFTGADNRNRPLMYTPAAVSSGSSVSHWSTTLTPNQIMEPSVNGNLPHAVTSPADLTFAMLMDIGWASSNVPRLAIASTHSGNFTQGQVGATYSLTVTNSGTLATTGIVRVADILPAGLTATGITGPGWTCTLVTVSCLRSDVLAISAAHPAITVTVNVSASPGSVTNRADAWGGASVPAIANDVTTIVAGGEPDMTVTKTHSGNFTKGQSGAQYVITARNSGTAATSGTVTVSDVLPTGLTGTAISGSGWTCTQPAGPCTRSDSLAASSDYPGITLTVNAAANAPDMVTNTASVTGGSETNSANNSASDPTNVVAPAASVAKAGIFRSGFFWLEDVNGDRQFAAPPDRAFAFGGVAGDIPITGDWNGSGTSKVGVYRPSNGLFVLDYDGDGLFTGADRAYNLGVGIQAGDVPVAGDWNGDGKTKIGLFRQGFFWILDTNGNGVFQQGLDQTLAFGGVSGDVPVVGDWNGSGTTKIGLFRQGFYWILDANGNGSLDNVNGGGGDQAFAFGGIAGDVPLVGDWNGSGTSKVGVFRSGFFWVVDANGNRTFDGTGAGQDLAFPFGGIGGDKAVVGKW